MTRSRAFRSSRISSVTLHGLLTMPPALSVPFSAISHFLMRAIFMVTRVERIFETILNLSSFCEYSILPGAKQNFLTRPCAHSYSTESFFPLLMDSMTVRKFAAYCSSS